MSITGPDDLAGLREVGRVTALTLAALESAAAVGVSTAELDEVAAAVLDAHGAHSAPAAVYGFPGRVLISVNDEIVHGVPGPRRLAVGDVVKLDVTLKKDGYVADAARTVIVGRGTRAARRLVSCADRAFDAGRRVARAGAPVNHIGRAVQDVVADMGFAVVRGLTGHGTGRTIHEAPDVPNEYDPWQTDMLTAGMVLTIEPMISAGSPDIVGGDDGWAYCTRDGSLAAHREETLLITEGEAVILTAV